MGPFEVLASWQAALIAVLAYSSTEFTKKIIDTLNGKNGALAQDPTASPSVWAYVGKELRKDAVFINIVVIPGLAMVWGVWWAVLLPIRPDCVLEYAAAHAVGAQSYLVYAAWGAFVGAFSDLLYTKVKKTFLDVAAGKSPNEG